MIDSCWRCGRIGAPPEEIYQHGGPSLRGLCKDRDACRDRAGKLTNTWKREPETFPPEVLQAFCEEQGLKVGILFASEKLPDTEGYRHWVVTWGETSEESDNAAEFGNRMKKALRWPPELCLDESAKVKELRAKIDALQDTCRCIEENLTMYVEEAAPEDEFLHAARRLAREGQE